MRFVFILMVGLAMQLSTVMVVAEDQTATESKDSIKVVTAETKTVEEPDQVVVYYLHMNRRCMTCEKLEAYSKEAVEAGFAEQLNDSSIVFKVENFEQDGNEHFAKDYQLFSQSLILSRLRDGKETEWKNLDKIWTLVGNKEKFITYVQMELASFMKPKKDE
jgi:hypothetical protein